MLWFTEPCAGFVFNLFESLSLSKTNTKKTFTNIILVLICLQFNCCSTLGHVKAFGSIASDRTYKLFFCSIINFMLSFQLLPHFDFVGTTNGFNRNLGKRILVSSLWGSITSDADSFCVNKHLSFFCEPDVLIAVLPYGEGTQQTQKISFTN